MMRDVITGESQESGATSVARKRLVLLASLFCVVTVSEWLLWLGGAYERTPWWVAAIFCAFALAAATECFRTAAKLEGGARRAWRCFGMGCCGLFLGELTWGIADVFMGIAIPTPSVADIFYFGFPLGFLLGIWFYRARVPSGGDALIHLGNLGIILSSTLLMYIFIYAEFLRQETPAYFAAVQVGYGIFDISAPLFGLIVLSFYVRKRQRHVMWLIFVGLCFNAAADFTFINDLMGDGYQASSLSSGSVLVCSAFIIWAAFEQRQLEHAPATEEPSEESDRGSEQWVSLLPPLAVVGVLAAALAQRHRLAVSLTPYIVTASLVFIVSLAVRNWWGHQLERRLRVRASRSQSALEGIIRTLETQNVALRKTQLDLEKSQTHLAKHQEHLEVLVGERTRELESSRSALYRADRLASLGTLAAGLAHELNNPLGIMQLQAEDALLLREKENSEDALRGMLAQLRRCAEIVKGVLRFSRDEVSGKRSVDLAEVVRRSVVLANHYATQSNVELECRIESVQGSGDAEGSFAVLGSAVELEQVVVNLLRNAIEASETGSCVYVELARLEKILRLNVVDEGSGMTDETREHAFDPFYTTKRDKGGTGLGLSIAHGIIEQHGGLLQVLSQEAKGTTLTFELPCH